MEIKKIRLGKTELMVTQTAFGALPVQRRTMQDAVKLLRAAYDGGINYFDTANAYTDSEEKIGAALSDVRHEIVISTKSAAVDRATATRHIELSLRRMKTDYIDLFQFHNPAVLPDAQDKNGAYAAALEAKKKGYIRHIGITSHGINLAFDAVNSGSFETMQFPFSYISGEKELELVRLCRKADVGFIAMKGLCGGLLTNAAACRAFARQYDNVVPIFGIQTMEELAQWLALEGTSAAMTPELEAVIRHDRIALAGDFCRGCGYCLPCPAGIEINNAARMAFLLRRSPYQPYLTDEWHQKMHQIDDCIGCNACKGRCPYGLDTPALLQKMLADYDQFYAKYSGK